MYGFCTSAYSAGPTRRQSQSVSSVMVSVRFRNGSITKKARPENSSSCSCASTCAQV
ncbi:hypothetical protein Y695_04012 [Hydrogenophaga sp. T4]|nr:hypothetical protein Y695_04012 [Hydrogenophaga sp. T4]